MGTYQVQTNLSVQTMKTSIWAIGSTSKGRGALGWEEGFAKVWLLNPRTGPDCKITQSLILLGCWANDSDWSFHSLHGEIGLHLICSPIKMHIWEHFCQKEISTHSPRIRLGQASPHRRHPHATVLCHDCWRLRSRSATVDASSSIAVVRRAVGHNLSCLASRCLARTFRLPPPRPLNFNHLTILALFLLQ